MVKDALDVTFALPRVTMSAIGQKHGTWIILKGIRKVFSPNNFGVVRTFT